MWWQNLLWTLLGVALGLLGQWLLKQTFWDTEFVQSRRLRRHQEKLDEILSTSRSDLVIGSFRIKQITIQAFEPPVAIGDVKTHFEPQPRTLPADLQELEFSYLPRRTSQLRRQGKSVDFNDLYGLKSLRIERPQQQGERRNRPELEFEPTNFRYYLMINDCLDDPILLEPGGDYVSIRQRYKLDLSSFQWSDVARLPIHQWFATVTGVVTGDNQLVVAIRSDMQSISESAGGETWYRASLSCAEGMLRPVDSATPPPAETPSPFLTVLRALHDELGLEQGRHYLESQVKLLGLGFDQKRCQPVGVFCLELERFGFLDVYDTWRIAKDRHEQMTLMPVAIEPQSIAELLLGKLTYREKPVMLFSNHQQAGALLVGFHRLGIKSLADTLAQFPSTC